MLPFLPFQGLEVCSWICTARHHPPQKHMCPLAGKPSMLPTWTVLATTGQNRAPKVVSHVQLDSHTLKRLKNLRILPSVASSPSWNVTPMMVFFHLLGRGFCTREIGGHQQLSESMLKKSSSQPTLSTFTSMKFLEHPPLLSQPKQQKPCNISIHKLLQVKLFPTFGTGIRWTTGVSLGLLT